MTTKEAMKLQKGARVCDKRTGHPFIFLETVKCWNGMLTSRELKEVKPHIRLACAFIKGHDYEDAFYANGPSIYFTARQLMLPSNNEIINK